MSAVPFAQLPDDARLWVFAAPHPLDPSESEVLLKRVDGFLDGWLAHGRAVVGARELRDDRFLLVGADERASGVSGCSIDSLYHTLQEVERELDVTLTDSSLVWFHDEAGEIHALPRGEFRERVRAGEVDEDTVVFDNTVAAVGAVRGGRWELPMRDSWHARAFGIAGSGVG